MTAEGVPAPASLCPARRNSTPSGLDGHEEPASLCVGSRGLPRPPTSCSDGVDLRESPMVCFEHLGNQGRGTAEGPGSSCHTLRSKDTHSPAGLLAESARSGSHQTWLCSQLRHQRAVHTGQLTLTPWASRFICQTRGPWSQAAWAHIRAVLIPALCCGISHLTFLHLGFMTSVRLV